MADKKWKNLTDKQKVDYLQSVLGDVLAFQHFLDELHTHLIEWLEIIENKPKKK